MKVTFSIIKADVGGWPGHSLVHPRLIETAEKEMENAVKKGLIRDFHVTHVGDDLELIMTHTKGVDSKEIHELAWKTFEKATEVA